MEKTIEQLKFEKAWVCSILMQIRDELKARGKISANRKIMKSEFTILEDIEATLDNVGAVEAVEENSAKEKQERLKWYGERGRFVFPDMKPPEGWTP